MNADTELSTSSKSFKQYWTDRLYRRSTNKDSSSSHSKRVPLKRSKSSQRSSDHDFFCSSSSRESFIVSHDPLRGGGGNVSRVTKARSRVSSSQDENSSRDLLSTSCDPNMLRKAKNELLLPQYSNGVPYRKLSLTPDLPRLERRTMLNNHPLQKQPHKLSTSEESDIVESDTNQVIITLNHVEHSVKPSTVSTHSHSDSDGRKVLPETPSNSSSASLRSKSSGGSKVRILDPSDNSLTSLSTSSSGASAVTKPTKHVIILSSDPSDLAETDLIDRKCNSDPENATEIDKLPELSAVVDKRKAFAGKKRKPNLLTPNVLADIGERSENSDQSFDHGESGSGHGSRPSAEGVPGSRASVDTGTSLEPGSRMSGDGTNSTDAEVSNYQSCRLPSFLAFC